MPRVAKGVRQSARNKKFDANRWEDIEAIRTLVAELSWLADQGRTNELASRLTEEIVYDVGEYGLYTGREAVRSFLETMGSSFDLRIHRTTNQVIEVQGRRATSRCYWNAELVWKGRALVGSGLYLDELVKIAGKWLLSARKTEITYLCPLEEGWAKTRFLKLV